MKGSKKDRPAGAAAGADAARFLNTRSENWGTFSGIRVELGRMSY
jgi:hypothetical protein